MLADIKFHCPECGQAIAVDSAAAGLAAHCPTCRNEVVVPALGGINDRDYGNAPRKLRRDGLGTELGIMALRDEQGEPRKELAPPDSALAVAREEISSLRHQLESRREECERLHASATHSQAELKSFQAERLAQKTDLANIRQRLATIEAHLAVREEELAAAEGANRQARAQYATLQNDLLIAKQRATATETQLNVKEREVAQLREGLHAERLSADAARREVESLQAEGALLHRAVATARAELAAATLDREQLAAAHAAFRKTQQKLIAAEKASEEAAWKCEALKQQAASLQRDLKETKTGRTLVELRSQCAIGEEERRRLQTELYQLAEESAKREDVHCRSERLLTKTRRQLAEAAKIAEASSESRVLQDNEILRGLIARQNAELESRLAELVRYKRARLAVRVLYALFALALAGVVAALLNALPHLGV